MIDLPVGAKQGGSMGPVLVAIIRPGTIAFATSRDRHGRSGSSNR
jgi:hypothetical protein